MDFETRGFRDVQLRVGPGDVSGKEGRRISGHAAVFNGLSEDLGGFRERILAGAFADSISNDDVRALWNHDARLILGRNKSGTLALKEDRNGLAFVIDVPRSSYGDDLLVAISRGDVDSMSFAFNVAKGGETWDDNKSALPVRTLSKVNLRDVSPVTYPAYPQTDVALRSLKAFKGADSSFTGWDEFGDFSLDDIINADRDWRAEAALRDRRLRFAELDL